MKRILLLLLFVGCGHVCVEEEVAQLEQRVWERTGHRIEWGESCCPRGDHLALDEIVQAALLCNPQLGARLEELGVAKADLVQAGLLTNPLFFWDWRLPQGRSSIEGGLLFALTDLWQRPIRKQRAALAADETAEQVLDAVLETVAMARHAAIDRLWAQHAFALHKGHLVDEIERRDRIAYRQGFGLESDWERDLSESAVGQVEIHIVQSRLELDRVGVQLCEVLGLQKQCSVVGKLTLPPEVKTGVEELIQIAQNFRPDLAALRLGVCRAVESVRLEQSRFIRNLGLGLAYEKSPGQTSGVGPALALQLPIFDQNNAQIAKARFLLRQAEERLREGEVRATAEVRQALHRYRAAVEQVGLVHKRVVPALNRAWAYAERYGKTMQVNLLYQLDARMRLEEAQQQELEFLRDAQNAFIDLERAVALPLRTVN